MYRIVLGKVSTLSAAPLPPGLREQAPQGPRRERWLAGRALLSHTLSPLPEMLSDEGEVGCDIEVIRPRANWRWLANAVFSLGEHAEMDAVHPDQQLEMFWRIWTRKEAIVKQRGGSAWQIVSVDSTYHSSLSVSHCQLENLSLAICTPTPFTLTADSVQWIDSVN